MSNVDQKRQISLNKTFLAILKYRQVVCVASCNPKAPNPYVTRNWTLMGSVIVDWRYLLVPFVGGPVSPLIGVIFYNWSYVTQKSRSTPESSNLTDLKIGGIQKIRKIHRAIKRVVY